eukprot:6933280-Lingulodinium_polyedra.AAC.1
MGNRKSAMGPLVFCQKHGAQFNGRSVHRPLLFVVHRYVKRAETPANKILGIARARVRLVGLTG